MNPPCRSSRFGRRATETARRDERDFRQGWILVSQVQFGVRLINHLESRLMTQSGNQLFVPFDPRLIQWTACLYLSLKRIRSQHHRVVRRWTGASACLDSAIQPRLRRGMRRPWIRLCGSSWLGYACWAWINSRTTHGEVVVLWCHQRGVGDRRLEVPQLSVNVRPQS